MGDASYLRKMASKFCTVINHNDGVINPSRREMGLSQAEKLGDPEVKP